MAVEKEKKNQANDANVKKQVANPTVEESWDKFVHFKWRSLSRHDAWNIGTSVVACGVVLFLFHNVAKGARNGDARQNSHDHDHGPNKEKACDVCLDDKRGHEFHRLPCCGHNASCKGCLVEMINTSLAERTTANILCPNRNCAQPLNGRTVRAITHAHPETYKKYQDVANQEYLDKHTTPCPTPNCSYAFINDGKVQQSMTCPKCKKQYCSKCREQHAAKVSCKEAKLQKDKNAAAKADDEWKKEHAKKCPSCKADIEKNDGCNHMTCKCRHEFCWECLARWKTCNCAWFPANQNNQPANGQGQQHVQWDNIFNGFDAIFNNLNNQAHNNQVPNVAQPAHNPNNNRPNVAQPAQNANNNRQNGAAANPARNNVNNNRNNANNANRNQPVRRQGR